MHLLIVDDDAVFRQELGDLLEQDGHTVTNVPSVAKALDALGLEAYDLIFTDLKMPRHSGLELLGEVRHRWPDTLVVMITGYATVDTAVEAMKVGAFDYVRKPFHLDQVHQVLARVAEELKFQGRSAHPKAVDSILHRWTGEGIHVLHVTDRSHRTLAQVTVAPVPSEARLVRDAVESFLDGQPRPGVVLEGVDRLFDRAHRGEFARFISGLRDRMDGKGPLVVTFDPARWSAADGEELQATLAGPATRSTLDALSNPIRRAVMQRAGRGPVSFSQGLEAAGLDESPKLSFHLRRLVEEGLLLHHEEQYRITERGRDALHLLAEWDEVASSGRTANAAIPVSRD
ncbi:MAG: response regulator [Thermoplasmata archaeon]|nr:response regulator [Thermoplasmata archaeon]